MKKVRIEVEWISHTELEVDDDWECPSTLDGFTKEQLKEIDCCSVSLIGWNEL